MNDKACIVILISPKFIPKGQTNNIPGNGLAPSRQQVSVGTNGGLVKDVYMRHSDLMS